MEYYYQYVLKKTNISKKGHKDKKNLENLMKELNAASISDHQFFDGKTYIEFCQEVEQFDNTVDNLIKIYTARKSTKLINKLVEAFPDYDVSLRRL